MIRIPVTMMLTPAVSYVKMTGNSGHMLCRARLAKKCILHGTQADRALTCVGANDIPIGHLNHSTTLLPGNQIFSRMSSYKGPWYGGFDFLPCNMSRGALCYLSVQVRSSAQLGRSSGAQEVASADLLQRVSSCMASWAADATC